MSYLNRLQFIWSTDRLQSDLYLTTAGYFTKTTQRRQTKTPYIQYTHTQHTHELVNIKNLFKILDVKQTKKLPHTLLQRLMTEYEIINNLKIRHFYNKLKQSTKHIVGMKQNVWKESVYCNEILSNAVQLLTLGANINVKIQKKFFLTDKLRNKYIYIRKTTSSLNR